VWESPDRSNTEGLVDISRAIMEKRTVPWTSLERDGEPTVDPDRFRGPEDACPGHWREFPNGNAWW